MKKLLISMIATSALLISCGGEEDKKGDTHEESKDILAHKSIKSAEKVVKNLCDCAEKEDPTDCRNTLPQANGAIKHIKETVEIPEGDSEAKQKFEEHLSKLEQQVETCREQLLRNEVKHLYGEHIEVLETYMSSLKADLEDAKSAAEEGSADARKKWEALLERLESEEFDKAQKALDSITGSTPRLKLANKLDSLQSAIFDLKP